MFSRMVRRNHVYAWIKNGSKCIVGIPWCQLSTTPGPCNLSELPHTCATAWASVPRWVSWATSFEMGFSRIVLGATSVPDSLEVWTLKSFINTQWIFKMFSMTVRQDHVYGWWIKNGLKCTRGTMVTTLYHPWASWSKRATTYVCHSTGKRAETSVSDDFLWNKFFKDSTERYGCTGQFGGFNFKKFY